MDESTLRSIALFESLPAEARRAIAMHADEIDVPERTELARQGEFAYEFFVIEDGSVEVQAGGEPVAELGPGDFFGEQGLLEHVERNASVVATSDLRVIVMTGGAFRQMAREMPDVGERIRAAVDERCRALRRAA